MPAISISECYDAALFSAVKHNCGVACCLAAQFLCRGKKKIHIYVCIYILILSTKHFLTPTWNFVVE